MFNNGLFLIGRGCSCNSDASSNDTRYRVWFGSSSQSPSWRESPLLPTSTTTKCSVRCIVGAEGSRKAGGSQTVCAILPMALVVCSEILIPPDEMKKSWAFSITLQLFTSTKNDWVDCFRQENKLAFLGNSESAPDQRRPWRAGTTYDRHFTYPLVVI